jgi:hypothetical protein
MIGTPPVSGGGAGFCPRATAIQQEAELSRLTYLGLKQEQSTDIEITTSEGDKITISSDARTEAALLTYDHLAFNGAGFDAEELQLVDLRAESSFELSVVGDLNEQEKADIEALLKDIGARLKAFLTGGAESGAETAAPGRYTSLDSFTADIEVHRELTYLNAVEARVARVAPAEERPEAQKAPEVVAPQAAEAQAAAPDAPALPQAAAQATPEVEPVAQQLAERVREHRPSRRMLKQLKKLLKGFLKELHAAREIDAGQVRQGEGVLDRMFRQIEPQGQERFEISLSRLSVRQEAFHLRYEMNASAQAAEPQVEETA